MSNSKKGYIKINNCLSEDLSEQQKGSRHHLYRTVTTLKIKEMLGVPWIQVPLALMQLFQSVDYSIELFFSKRMPMDEEEPARYIKQILDYISLNLSNLMSPLIWFVLLLVTMAAFMCLLGLLTRIAVRKPNKQTVKSPFYFKIILYYPVYEAHCTLLWTVFYSDLCCSFWPGRFVAFCSASLRGQTMTSMFSVRNATHTTG